jgi:hypothetical protein
VGGVAVLLAKEAIEAMLGRGKGSWDVHAQAPKPRSSHRDEQRLDRLDALLQIADAAVDEVATWIRSRRFLSLRHHGERTGPDLSAKSGGSDLAYVATQDLTGRV